MFITPYSHGSKFSFHRHMHATDGLGPILLIREGHNPNNDSMTEAIHVAPIISVSS